ncbi:beta-glucosidase [Candidatus Uhrbacteria bacterium CG10_big_fil_rev_8_21_14_0_10_48_11]|uniref:beta-glucosidase n=1 Tax=Candidatus Uhrbacteria bacterium CG10_big_fil_rev_8_21_14_0_10_48_11 TaxID=1975037 RepID=A0A2M8LEN1_9BACT|nr:MAG: beta-glucosidase [Candidatus Uhrbacteria bacterium CG10_big_fil_rev_8_21_14_0_10_48_11]
MGATIFPQAIGLGASRDADLVRRVATATADEMAATGIYWSYSPNLDVPQDTRWGKTYETFGSDTANVTQLGAAYLAGTQESSTHYFNVLATAKHFLGGGAMVYGTSRNKDFKIEEGTITLDEQALRQDHLTPFKKAVSDGLQAVMVGTATWNEVINPANHYLLTDVLKKELGFSGFVVSDWYAIYEITSDKYQSMVTGINAGVDMVMTPFDYKEFVANMQRALAQGDITKDRLDDAVRRILTVKFETGLFDRPAPTADGLSVVGSQQHKDLARQAVAESQVLLKNANDILPLSPSVGSIIVAGSGANNLGRQSGGWTVEWQGVDGNWIPGTTILAGIKNTVSKSTQVAYNLDANFPSAQQIADVGIAVVSEKPYAEGWGDNANPRLSDQDLIVIKKLKKQSEKLIVIIISGRPLEISPYISNWDGVVASWLPGTEGQGVADVLFGLKPFIGKLPIRWNY